MSTHSDTTRAIDRKHTSPLLVVLVLMALAFTGSCSMSLVDKGPEVLRYCRVVSRSDPAISDDAAAQTSSAAASGAANQCAGGADRICEDAEIVHAMTEGDAVNCSN
jgi:hypothetical protein